jgi:hypothetical protein
LDKKERQIKDLRLLTFFRMPHCGFCGKLCPTAHGLKRHIEATPGCKKASNEDFVQYAKGLWDDVPANPENAEQQQLPTLPIEPDLPDFHLEDIEMAEGMFYGEEANLPPPPPQQPLDDSEPQQLPQQAAVDQVPDNEDVNNRDGARYVENFPAEQLAGATWGRCKPLFESLDEEQKKEGGSRWAPFEDEEEWQLAEWLIQNVGQKQMDLFLKLPIVSFLFFYVLVNN